MAAVFDDIRESLTTEVAAIAFKACLRRLKSSSYEGLIIR